MKPPQEADADDPDVLDGNAAAGLLQQIFASDITTANVVCAGCENTSCVAALKLYGLPMGHILRCPNCHLPLVRVVARELECWVDMTGVHCLRLTLSGSK
jgi:hypothetical protein